MSLFKYFAPSKSKPRVFVAKQVQSLHMSPSLESYSGISSQEAELVSTELIYLSNDEDKKRTKYKEEEKVKIVRYAINYTKAARNFISDFPKLTESTVRGWVVKYIIGIGKKTARCRKYNYWCLSGEDPRFYLVTSTTSCEAWL